jgi:hypothetical protein
MCSSCSFYKLIYWCPNSPQRVIGIVTMVMDNHRRFACMAHAHAHICDCHLSGKAQNMCQMNDRWANDRCVCVCVCVCVCECVSE